MHGARAKSPEGASSSSSRQHNEEGNVDDWERRFATGEIPDDFLRVTEPKADATATTAQAEDRRADPAVGNLVDVNSATTTAAAAAAVGGKGDHDSSRHEDTTVTSPEKEKKADGNRGPLSAEEQDHALALALQEQLDLESEEQAAASAAAGGGGGYGYAMGGTTATVAAPESMVGKLTVTVVEARLAKNYGLTRMDPYCRVRVGHSVYETPTCANGSKEPKWNKTFHCYLLQGIKQMGVEIYDECTFSQDALIAHGLFEFPETLTQGKEVVDVWFPLSGQEGAEKEGMLHVILSLQRIAPGQPLALAPQLRAARNVGAGGKTMYYQTAPTAGQD